MSAWHIWVVGFLSLAWNAFGAFDYFMTKTENAAYLAEFSPEQLAYFDSFPVWVTFFWALAVWLSVFGSILILAHNALAAPVLGVAFFSMAITTAHGWVFDDVKPHDLMGPSAIYLAIVIFVVSLFLWIYARWMCDRHRLR
jgi:hypothetical protein